VTVATDDGQALEPTSDVRRIPLGMVTGLLFLLAVPACSQAPPEEEPRYVASSRGQVYYWVECEAWHALSEANLRWFATAEEAEAAGYRPSGARGCQGPERTAGPGPAETGFCTIERIIDGDTVTCVEGAERIRLLLIDAPELSQGPFGRLAREAMIDILPPGERARVEIDVQARDRFGRLLAYLHTPAGTMVNEEMVRAGYAVVSVHPPNVRHVERLRAAGQEAREARRGLWSGSAFECDPADHRAGRC
jgi:micrococcal nuclease